MGERVNMDILKMYVGNSRVKYVIKSCIFINDEKITMILLKNRSALLIILQRNILQDTNFKISVGSYLKLI